MPFNESVYFPSCRYLMKAYDNMKAGNEVSGSVSYLNKATESRSTVGVDLNVHSLVEALQYRACR